MAKVNTYGTKLLLGLLILVFNPGILAGQSDYRLVINTSEKDTSFLQQQLGLKNSFPNRKLSEEFISKLPSLLQAKGFIASSIDSIHFTDSAAFVDLYLGDQYELVDININAQNRLDVEQALRKNQLSNKGLTFQKYQLVQENLLDYFENNGYPFAKVYLDSLSINKEKIEATLKIDKGILYKIDSIRTYGPAKISRNFIHRYLDIKKGSIYKRDKLEMINLRLLELPYLQQMQNWDITMLNTGSIVNLYLEPKKSNQINVLAGFLPSNDQTGGKLLLTVDANVQLKNAFGGGESLGLVWQQIQPQSPRLNLQFQQPYMFNSPYGMDLQFELYKKDSTFLNINALVGLQYALSANETGRISVQSRRSNVLMADTISIKNLKQLPDVADVSSVNVALDYDYTKTSYRYNPRSGNEVKLSLSAGNKKIRKSNAVTQIKDPSFNYSGLYDSIKLNTYQVRLRLQAAHYFPLGKQSVLKAGLNSGMYESPSYFKNELFQIGGYRLMRGFDEEGIFASRYAVGTVEYRYLLGLNSYFFGFTDVGYSKDNSIKIASSNTYIGAGLGLAFETKGGLFNISFAAGKRNDLPFDIRQSKIHFGYVSLF